MAVLATVLVAALVGGAAGAVVQEWRDEDRQPVSSLAGGPLSDAELDDQPTGSVEDVAQAVLPSVVSIQVQTPQGSASGSGVVLSSDGQILTNSHVVAAARNGGELTVRFNDDSTAPAHVVGLDPTTDLAVIQAEDVRDLRPATLGSSGNVDVGQTAVAIGSPLGLSGTVTSGIVSSLHRPVRTGGQGGDRSTVIDAIQTDAPINPGNSGGPLVNLKGQVIGINSAIATAGGEGGNIGLGFAIPIDQARRIATQLIEDGEAVHAQIGVRVSNAQNQPGAQVVEVTSEPATSAGLRPGDVVTRLGDRNVDSADALVAAVRAHQPGDEVTLTVRRGGEETEVTLTLGSQSVS